MPNKERSDYVRKAMKLIDRVVEVEYTKKSGGYAMAFVYLPKGDSLVVKGSYLKVRDYINKNHPISIFNLLSFKEGKIVLNTWNSPMNSMHIRLGKDSNDERNYYYVRIFERIPKSIHIKIIEEKRFRRMPRRWISMYNQAISLHLNNLILFS